MITKQKIRKAVFPVAGLGTRFLPATKATPKEMLPIVDKPLIQYAVEDAIAAGITDLIFITSSNKRAIEDHFDSSYELEAKLLERNKHELLKIVKDVLPKEVNCVYVRQKEALGLGHAILCAKNLVGDEPFAVLLADDLIASDAQSSMQQLAKVFAEQQHSIIAVEEVLAKDTMKYGIISPIQAEQTVTQIDNIVEKPAPEKAPSKLAVIGRYILTADIFTHLEKTQPGSGGEIQLTDAIAALLKEQPVMAYRFEGKRYDCGNKLGYLQATITYALQHPELHKEFKQFMTEFKSK